VAPVLFGFTAPTSELLEEVGGRTPKETEDRAVISLGAATLLDGEGGKMGFRVVEASLGPEVAVMMVVEEEVRVTGQTVVEMGTIIVLTGQSSVPGPHP
jgi:hypothetical protein